MASGISLAVRASLFEPRTQVRGRGRGALDRRGRGIPPTPRRTMPP